MYWKRKPCSDNIVERVQLLKRHSFILVQNEGEYIKLYKASKGEPSQMDE